MSSISPMAEPALRRHIDVFVNSFFANGARDYLRKTTRDAPWLNLGIMEKTNPDAFYASKLFAGMNIIGGGSYSLGHGFIHGYLNGSENTQVERAIAHLNRLGAEEIIFYHDESVRGLETAREMGLALQFSPVSLLEWLVRQARDNKQDIRPLDANAAVQLPCSWQAGDGKNALLEELFDLIGVRRVERKYDFGNRLCCGARAYFGLVTGDTLADSDRAEEQVGRNVQDAVRAGAEYMVTTCPYCYAALAGKSMEAGIVPAQVESLVSLALYGEKLPQGLAFL